MDTVDLDLTEITETMTNLASTADVWARLGHDDVVARLKTLSLTLIEETELLFAEQPKPKPQPPGRPRHRK